MPSLGSNRGADRPRPDARDLVSRFAPPLALMSLIFVMSHIPDLDSGLGLFDLIARKVIHMTEYGLLFFLWLRALGFRRPLLAAAITLAYTVTDEFHQTFVAGRHGNGFDLLIDAAGVAVAWALWLAVRRRADARRSDPAALGGDQDGLGPVDRAQLPVDVVEVGADGAGGER
jgi:VanZ like protein